MFSIKGGSLILLLIFNVILVFVGIKVNSALADTRTDALEFRQDTVSQYECNTKMILANAHERESFVLTVCACKNKKTGQTYWTEVMDCDSLMQQPLLNK